ncbi:MAG TPA: ATP-dependent DNA helicase RecG [Acidobacteriaceae bacterium]|nr:ATP-dependent DNA helicase RecG [Acidobacteriaceae bacterium]
MTLELQTPVKYVRRIGERIATGLAERGIETVEDLLYHLPFRYEDRLRPRPLSSYQPGEMASVIGEVRGTVLLRTRSDPIFEMTVGVAPLHPTPNVSSRPDAEHSSAAVERPAVRPLEPSMDGLLKPPPIFETVKCLWFHGAYLKDKFRAGQRIALYGRLEGSRSGNALNAPPGSTRFKMVQPTFEILPDASATGEDAEFTTLEMGRIVPVYPSLGGTTPWGSKLTSRWLRRVMWTIFRDLKESEAKGLEASGARAEETLPHALLDRLGLPGRMEALEAIHFPAAGTSSTDLMSARTPAHRRLIFEELWYLELGLELKRRRLRERQGTAFATNDQVRGALKQVLPFKPTAAQKRVLGEIVTDMRAPRPMRRLLQGDVGSGKTIVALQAALVAIENGYQVAMMAPTEILATQHYLSARKLLRDAISPTRQRPYRITLLTGSLDDRGKRDARGRIFRGETDLAIGTHALVEEKVDFDNLGLVIVDEQHRFGVQQRFKLMRKPGASGEATEPDVLVMTATPIPRTLALTIYGDLEASILDELPPGRTPIVTRRMPEQRADEVWEFVRKQVSAGRQAYIVYPIIEGDRDDQPELDFAHDEQSDSTVSQNLSQEAARSSRASQNLSSRPGAGRSLAGVERPAVRSGRRKAQASLAIPAAEHAPKRAVSRAKLRSASEMFDELSSGALAGLRLGLLHGRMSADDKDVTMARFQRGEIDVLISTTVIEVGVDVPNATVMVIEHAERFGLAQMHQLRGRVGRGAAKSFCVLLTGSKVSPEAELRLDAMVQTQDGFALAEIDLAQRGPGEFFGTRQAGLPEFRVANLARDRDMLELAKAEAAHFVEAPDPAITPAEREAVWTRLKRQWQRRYGLVEA